MNSKEVFQFVQCLIPPTTIERKCTMKRILPLVLFLGFLLAACSSSEFATYRPPDSTGPAWSVNVQHTTGAMGMTSNFKVTIDDSTVIDKSSSFFTGSAEATGSYHSHPVRLIVTYSNGFFGIGRGYHAMVFIDNQLVANFKF